MMTVALNHSREPPGLRPIASTVSPEVKPPSLHSLVMGVCAGGAAAARGVFQRLLAPTRSRLRRVGAPAARFPGRREAREPTGAGAWGLVRGVGEAHEGSCGAWERLMRAREGW